MVNVKIRACEKQDISCVIDLMKELTEVTSTESSFIKEDVVKIFEEMESKPDIYLNIVAEADGVIIGFISMIFYKTPYHKGGTALINELIINRNHRGKGIGSMLIEKAKEEAISRGMDELEVGTEVTNKDAQIFYKKCGFDEEFFLLGMEF